MGSKEKILKFLDYMFEREHAKKYFIDPFCGGYAVSAYALHHKKHSVLANDLNHYVIALYREIFFNNS
jgi:D12 class N6 adenine-specific DNA methyltransferase.